VIHPAQPCQLDSDAGLAVPVAPVVVVVGLSHRHPFAACSGCGCVQNRRRLGPRHAETKVVCQSRLATTYPLRHHPASYQLGAVRVQLNLKMPADLVARLKREAQQQQLTLTALVERRLAGDYPSASQLDHQLDQRLAALEARLAALERGHHQSAPAAALQAPAAADPLPARRLTQEEAATLLPLPAVARELGLKAPSSITNWIARNGHAAAVGKEFRGWRLRGKGLLPDAVTPGWLFERCG
jgi:hypothetical protein